MNVPRKKLCASILTTTILFGLAGPVWRARAQGRSAVPQTPVQPLDDRQQPPPVTAGDRGSTYHALEEQATHVTTRFADAITMADRTADGSLSTRVTDLAGNEVGSFRVRHVDAQSDALEFTLPGVAATKAARRSGLRPTLDWSNHQAYSLWKDRSALGRSKLEWQDTLMRPVGAARRDVDAEALQTETEWQGGFSATVIRKIVTHVSYVTNRPTTGVVFISAFKKDGTEVGSSQWWPQEQTLAWSFPGLTSGYIDAERLKPLGGWKMTPDMAWLNTQSLAFYQFHTLVQTKGSVSERRPGWIERLGSLVMPPLHADSAGCDDLHWLDQSVFRPCCDNHDLCYARQSPACSWMSWWMWWSSWQCDQCNIGVVFCFATGGNSGRVYVRFF